MSEAREASDDAGGTASSVAVYKASPCAGRQCPVHVCAGVD